MSPPYPGISFVYLFDDNSTFHFIKTVQEGSIRFPRVGNASMIVRLRHGMKNHTYLYVIGRGCTTMHSMRHTRSAVARWGQGLAVNTAKDTRRVRNKEGTDYGLMHPDSFVIFYDAETCRFAGVMPVEAEPIALPVRITCWPRDFFIVMQQVCRASAIDALLHARLFHLFSVGRCGRGTWTR